MEISLSPIDLSRTGPAAQDRDAGTREPRPAAPPERREVGPGEAAVFLTQAGLVGRALMGATPPAPSAQPSTAPGEPRRAERVLAPWGVPMLPSDAASEARRAAAREAEHQEKAKAGPGATRSERAGAR